MLKMMTSDVPSHKFISEHWAILLVSLLMFIIGIILELWVIRTAKRGILRGYIKKIFGKIL